MYVYVPVQLGYSQTALGSILAVSQAEDLPSFYALGRVRVRTDTRLRRNQCRFEGDMERGGHRPTATTPTITRQPRPLHT